MPKANRKSPTEKETARQESRRFEIGGVLMIAVGLFALTAIARFDVGIAGYWTHTILEYLFGLGAFIPALALIFLGARYVYRPHAMAVKTRDTAWGIYFVLGLITLHWWYVPTGQEIQPSWFPQYGGALGGAGLLCLRTLFGETGVKIALLVILVVNTIFVSKWTVTDGVNFVKGKAQPHWEKASDKVKETVEAHRHVETTPTEQKQRAQFFDFDKSKEKPPVNDEPSSDRHTPAAAVTPFTPPVKASAVAPEPSWMKPEPDTDTEQVKPDIAPAKPKSDRADYKLPPLSLLTKTRQSTADTQAEVAENAQKLEELLASFGVETKIIHASRGPSVTRYELEPGPGVKVSKIVNLADDIALQLAATDVRIEAPIPGKAAVGIEVPNREISSVGLREVLACDEFQHAVGGIAVGLGEDITGQPVITDLAKMPHLLVAGSTGSGKSVCINTLVSSILLRSYPDEVKLILIDPKVVELAQYNHIPHLLTPVVTDVKKAAGVLRWAVREMENRYRLFASAKVRNITGYNEANPDSPLPLVVIIIDELADLMMVAPHDVEDAIARLAQMARAAGLHLVLATQRPSVDVLTGTIKANIPSRISFAVSSQIDSRTILDMAGAEKLLGKGDMLFYPIGAPKPRRVQGAFISDADVEKLVNYIKKQGQPEYNETVVQPVAEAEEAQQPRWEDELLPDAIRMVMDTEQASVSMLQRRFRVGYTRAGRLIDTMENMGIVGPSLGSKARDILLTKDEVEELLARYEGNSES